MVKSWLLVYGWVICGSMIAISIPWSFYFVTFTLFIANVFIEVGSWFFRRQLKLLDSHDLASRIGVTFFFFCFLAVCVCFKGLYLGPISWEHRKVGGYKIGEKWETKEILVYPHCVWLGEWKSGKLEG